MVMIHFVMDVACYAVINLMLALQHLCICQMIILYLAICYFHGVDDMHTRLNKSTHVWKHSQACLFQVEGLLHIAF